MGPAGSDASYSWLYSSGEDYNYIKTGLLGVNIATSGGEPAIAIREPVALTTLEMAGVLIYKDVLFLTTRFSIWGKVYRRRV